MTVQELASEMGVGEKTIRRDLDAFLMAGFPLTEMVEQFGRKSYCIDPDKANPECRLPSARPSPYIWDGDI